MTHHIMFLEFFYVFFYCKCSSWSVVDLPGRVLLGNPEVNCGMEKPLKSNKPN